MSTRILRAAAAAFVTLMLASTVLAESPISRRTDSGFKTAFFEHSLLETSRAQARLALRSNPHNVDALFVEMEAAALEADTPAVLDAALRILSISAAEHDDRASIAAGRVYDLAANTQEFVKVLPRVQAIAGHENPQAEVLRAALVKAGMDGARGVNVSAVAKAAGIITDWRAAGPFGEYANLDFNRAWPPQRDLLMGSVSDGQQVELFHVDDGMFRLPDYFGHDGIFYAMSRVEVAGGRFDMRVESAGTLEVFVDGKSVLRHDSRFRVVPEIASATIHLGRGEHTVLVKFFNTAEPFRVMLAQSTAARSTTVAGTGLDAQYVAASSKFWEGDYAWSVAAFEQLRATHESAAVDWMLYQSWAHAEKDSPEAATLLDAILRQTPEALAADYELAARDSAAGRLDDALQHLSRVLGRRAYFAPAEDLMGQIAVRMHLPVRASRSIEILLDIHPSCDVLRRAQHFFAGQARYDRARQVDDGLSECGLDSIAYATSLSESGRHQEAAAAAQQVVARNPLDRNARQMLARELALAGDADGARAAIQALAKIAPNSARFRRMADTNADPLTLLDNPLSIEAAADTAPFYAPYRRDGVEVVKEAANRHFSGGPALQL
ncbi:MAG: tetratricopeptide repeat protein, partial [Terriglobales bacterium]